MFRSRSQSWLGGIWVTRSRLLVSHVTFRTVSRPARERIAIIEGALSNSLAQHLDMELDGSGDANVSRYKCRNCGLTFTVGYRSVIGQERRRFEVTEAVALNTPCPGLLAPASP